MQQQFTGKMEALTRRQAPPKGRSLFFKFNVSLADRIPYIHGILIPTDQLQKFLVFLTGIGIIFCRLKISIPESQKAMAELFDCSPDNISLHLKNIYSDGELSEKATAEDFSAVQQEGKRNVIGFQAT